jgi:sterol desaturase/sphingolipid hydroxylase (fatty acid hydroxylase superfamily)
MNTELAHWARGAAEALARYVIVVGAVGGLLWMLPLRMAPRIQSSSAAPGQLRREALASISSGVIFFSIFYFSARTGLLSPQPLGSLPLWRWGLALLTLLVVHDTWFYWTHRLLHTRWFWRIHRLHHESRTPNVWTAYAFHPVEALVNGAFILPASLITPLSFPLVLTFMVTMIARNALAHGGREAFPAGKDGRPLFRWMTTVTHHDLHHQGGGGNFGLYFSFWDWVMGTARADYVDAFRQARLGETPNRLVPAPAAAAKPAKRPFGGAAAGRETRP